MSREKADNMPADAPSASSWILGKSRRMLEIQKAMLQIAPTPATVLIEGEYGTGKNSLAHLIHQHSRREGKPFFHIHCAHQPDLLPEMDLFGDPLAAKKSALFERVRGSSMFLDEVNTLSPFGQGRLSRFYDHLEQMQTDDGDADALDVRMICSTSADLAELCRRGKFLPGLLYRFDVARLRLPPLRERLEDLEKLADKLLDDICRRYRREGKPLISACALKKMAQHAWPGNLRELSSCLERSLLFMGECNVISRKKLLLPINDEWPESKKGGEPGGEGSTLEDYFQHFVLKHQQNMSETDLARKLGISRKSLWERRQRLGLLRDNGPQKNH